MDRAMPSRSVRRTVLALAAWLPTMVAGCNRTPAYELAEVTGVVTVKGKPMPDLIVAFLPNPEKGTQGPRATGKTNDKGEYRMACDDGRQGAVVGMNYVLVTDERTSLPEEEARKPGAVFPPSRIALNYSTVVSTPLQQEVKAGPQTIDFVVNPK